MSKWDKLIKQIKNLSTDIRFEEIKKILESYGYVMRETSGGSSMPLSEKAEEIRLPYRDTTQSKRFILKWFEI